MLDPVVIAKTILVHDHSACMFFILYIEQFVRVVRFGSWDDPRNLSTYIKREIHFSLHKENRDRK